MLAYLMVFSAGALLGSICMGLYAALVNFRDSRGDW